MEVRIVRIKNVINNNILCAIDEKGKEMIVTGKGIGFKRKRGEFIDETQIQKVYFMEDKAEQKKLRELVQQIPIEHLELTQQLISMIKEQLRKKLNESLLITLADHISFAIRRKEEGIAFSNPLAGSIMCYYPQEYHLGQQCLKIIREQCGCDLPKDEATSGSVLLKEARRYEKKKREETERALDSPEVTETSYADPAEADTL